MSPGTLTTSPTLKSSGYILLEGVLGAWPVRAFKEAFRCIFVLALSSKLGDEGELEYPVDGLTGPRGLGVNVDMLISEYETSLIVDWPSTWR